MATLMNPPPVAPQVHYYRSPSLLSPDHRYAAYSRVQLQVQPEFFLSRVSSVLFLENLQTGDLQAITPTSPLADNPFLNDGEAGDGKISIVIPVSWSESGDRLLARAFESLFCSDIASDYGVVVDTASKRTSTLAPTHISYTTAVLLGWSHSYPGQVLFQAGNLGEENWPLWAVNLHGQTVQAEGDRPILFGELASSIWMGPQRQS